MQTMSETTQSGFNKRQKASFNYRVADSEMKARTVRCYISMILDFWHPYQAFPEIAVLVCQGVSRASITSAKSRASLEKPKNTVFLSIVLSTVDEFSHSLFYFVLAGHYPVGQRQMLFHGTLCTCFTPSFENYGRSRLQKCEQLLLTASALKSSTIQVCFYWLYLCFIPLHLLCKLLRCFSSCCGTVTTAQQTHAIASTLHSPDVPHCVGERCIIGSWRKTECR